MFFRVKKIDFAAATRIGSRERNEDAVFAREKGGCACFVVADGLGGHGLGDLASKTLTDVFAQEFDKLQGKTNRDFLKHAFGAAQKEILALQEARGVKNQIKTTAVALSISDGKYAFAHVGDSRLYRFKRCVCDCRTIDHSVPQILALSKEISDAEIANHPDRSRLLSAFGDESPSYEVSKEATLRRGTSFLLCSDGVWEHVSQENLAPSGNSTADAWLSEILTNIENTGHKKLDDYSAITVHAK